MAITDRFQPLIERGRDQLATMRARDRRLLLGLIVAGTLMFLFGCIWLMKGALNTREGRVADRQEALRRIHLLATDYADSKSQADAIEAQVAEYSGTDLSAYLEKVAQRTNVSDRLDSVRQKSSSDDGDLVETVYTVKITKLLQEELADFLYEMETTGYPLRVRSMTVKTRKRSGEVTLNIDLDIAAFKISQGTGEQ